MRRAIFSVMAISLVAMLAGAGSLAFFSDTEVSKNNTLQAGALDLLVGVNSTATYTDKVISWDSQSIEPDNLIFNWKDVKPGDNGEATITLHVDNNDAWLEMKVGNILNEEMGRNEPEMKVDFTDGEVEGELAQNLHLKIWEDMDEVDPGNNVYDDGEEVFFDDTAIHLPERLVFGMIPGCENYYIGFSWMVPFEVGNEIQSDMVQFDVIFSVEQYRNQSDPASNPFREPDANILLVDSPTTGSVGTSLPYNGDSDLYLVDLDHDNMEAQMTYVDNFGENFPNVDALASSIDGELIYAVDKTTKHFGIYHWSNHWSTGVFEDKGVLTGYPGGEVLLATSPDDVIYMASMSDDKLYTIDVAAVQAHLVGDTGINLSGSDLAFNADARLYVWTNNNTVQPAGLYKLDPNTVAATLIGARPGGVGFSVTGMALDLAGFGDILISEAQNDEIHVLLPDGTLDGSYDMVGDLTDHISGDMSVRVLIDP